MALVPYTFANQSGQIPLSELDANFANVKAFAETAGNVTGNTQANITALGTLTALTVSGNVIAPLFVGSLTGNVTGNFSGNVTGNILVAGANTQVLFNDGGTANATAGMTFNKVTNNFVVTGNITGANLVTLGRLIANTVSSSGNVVGNDLLAANLIFSNNVISANGSIFGNGLFSSSGNIGVPVGVTTVRFGNSNPSTVWIGGNASNIYIANVNSTTQVAGNLTAGGNFSTTGNITGGNIIGTIVGTVSTTSVSASGNITGGNLITTGQVSATGNITGGNLSITGTSTLTGVATAPTAANGTNNTQVATTAFVTNSLLNLVPSGVIVMWSGSIASVPSGWFLCNGANGTPDLRNRFIVGAGSTYAVNATGGSADAIVVAHTHTASSVVSDPGHSHTYTAPASGIGDATGTDPEFPTTASASTGSSTTGITVATTVNSSGSSGTNANLPPYYALAYIMKA